MANVDGELENVPKKSGNDMEFMIALALNLGLIISSMVVAAGGAMLMVEHGSTPIDFKALAGQSLNIAGVPGVLGSAMTGEPRAIILLGLLLLVATPIVRVALSVVLFLKRRDYLYVGITSAVLAILIFAISGGH